MSTSTATNNFELTTGDPPQRFALQCPPERETTERRFYGKRILLFHNILDEVRGISDPEAREMLCLKLGFDLAKADQLVRDTAAFLKDLDGLRANYPKSLNDEFDAVQAEIDSTLSQRHADELAVIKKHTLIERGMTKIIKGCTDSVLRHYNPILDALGQRRLNAGNAREARRSERNKLRRAFLKVQCIIEMDMQLFRTVQSELEIGMS